MIVRAALIRMMASRAAVLVLMVAGFAVLGRLLSPAEFGHFALALAIFGLAERAVEFGLRQYLIRSDEVDRDTFEAAAGLSLWLAVVVALVCLAAAWMLGGSLLPAATAQAMVPLSLALLVGPFALGTEALLQRSITFGLISVTEVVRVAVDTAIAVALALAGAGAVALGCGLLASRLAVAAILLAWGGRENRVRPRIGAAHWRGFAGFGGRVTAIRILPAAFDLALVSLLGAALGAATLGLFNRARTIHQILDRTLFEAVKPVVLPAMSAALRAGTDPRRIYLVKLDYLTAICWPGFALIGLLAAPLVEVMLGPQWREAVPAVQILALTGLGLPSTKMSQKLFVALDETADYLRLQITRDLVRLPLAAAGAFVSLEAFAAAFVIGNWYKAVAIARYLHRRLGDEPGGYRMVALRAGAITLATLVGPGLVLTADLSALVTLLVALPLGGAGWLVAAAAVRHPVIGELRGAAGQALRALRPLLAGRL